MILPTIVQSQPPSYVKTSKFDPRSMVLELPIEAHQDPQSLIWAATRSFLGKRAVVWNLATALGGIKSITPYKDSDAFYILRAIYQGLDPANPPSPDSQIVTVWKLQPARLTKPLWMIPRVRNTMIAIFKDAQTRNRFRTDFEALVRGDTTSNNPTPVDSTSSWKLSFTELMRRYKVTAAADTKTFELLLGSYGLGSDSFPVAGVMLSRVDVCPSNASVTAAGVDFDNFGGLYTTGALLRIESDLIPLIRSKIRASDRLMAGFWIKEMPSFNQEDANRVRVETNYTFADEFDAFIYGAPIL